MRRRIAIFVVSSAILWFFPIFGSNSAFQAIHYAYGASSKIPLLNAINEMEPHDVWRNFYEITQIPRPSHHEEQAREFLAHFGNRLGLETITDESGNVIIRKPPAAGMENRKGVVLQAHMDMVAQKTSQKIHDFLQDPIQAYVDDEWVRADGTTLGADDGIGVAMAMAILESKKVAIGPLDVLFTVNEEDGMDGALGLKPGVLKGDLLINLDSETEGTFTIGSAGGLYANIQSTYPETALPADMTAFRVTIQGLKGGHSGVDIDLGRGHAIKLLVRLLNEATLNFGLRLGWFDAGTAANAIPREASALVCLPQNLKDDFLQNVKEYEAVIKAELADVESGLAIAALPDELPAKVMDEKVQRKVLNALYGTPQGVMRMSNAVSGLVESSVNTGIVQIRDGMLKVACLVRSSVDSSISDIAMMYTSVWGLAGFEVQLSGRYPGWNPNPNSEILHQFTSVYKRLFNQEPRIEAIHAGLECSTIGSKYPNFDIIAIGPTLKDVHSPDERLFIPSVSKTMDLLVETLRQVPEKQFG